MKRFLSAYPRLNALILGSTVGGVQVLPGTPATEVASISDMTFSPAAFLFGLLAPPVLAYVNTKRTNAEPPTWQRYVEPYINGYYLVAAAALSLTIAALVIDVVPPNPTRNIGTWLMAGAAAGFVAADYVAARFSTDHRQQ